MAETYFVRGDAVLDVLGELLLVGLLVIFEKLLHVISNVLAEDVVTVHIGAEFLALGIIAGKSLGGMGDIQATIGSALHGSENTSSGGSSRKADIEEASEGAGLVFLFLLEELVSVHFGGTQVDAIELELLQQTASQQETGAVGGGVVGQTNLDTEARQFVSIRSADNLVAFDLGVSNLADDVLIGKADNQTVLWGVVLVLVLHNQASPGIVVSAAL